MRIYQWLKPLLFALPPELAHRVALQACKVARFRPIQRSKPRLQHDGIDVRIGDLHFDNPLGLAAGWDKNGDALEALASFAWGHFEVGSVSAFPSVGNRRPRLWRLVQDEGLIVHYGLPNRGAESVASQLRAFRAHLQSSPSTTKVGLNLVRTNDRYANAPCPLDPIEDYLFSLRQLHDLSDYITLNLSCPNTDGQSEFFDQPTHLNELLSSIQSELTVERPLFLKITPTTCERTLGQLLETVDPFGFVTGFHFNLASGKPDWLELSQQSKSKLIHPGAVSGTPVRAFQLDCLRQLARMVPTNRYHLGSSGGISSVDDAYERICAGASLIQIYTGLIYQGPQLVRDILDGLAERIRQDGFQHISEAVGTKL